MGHKPTQRQQRSNKQHTFLDVVSYIGFRFSQPNMFRPRLVLVNFWQRLGSSLPFARSVIYFSSESVLKMCMNCSVLVLTWH